MDPELRKLLLETHELAKENNELLHRVRAVQKRAAVWRAFKIFILVGLAFGSFYFIEPYLARIMDLYSSAGGQLKSGNFFQR